MNNKTKLESIRVVKFDGKKTFGLDQIHNNIFFEKELSKEETFLVNLIRAIYGDFHAIEDKNNNCGTTRIPYWRCFDIFYDFKYREIEVKTANKKILLISKLNDYSASFEFIENGKPSQKLLVVKDKKNNYEKLSNEFDLFVDHARLVEIPINRCYPDPDKVVPDFAELRELIDRSDKLSTCDLINSFDGVLCHLENTPLDDVLGKFIAGRNLSGFNHKQLKETLRNIFGVVNDLIKRYFSDLGIKVELKTSARLDAKDDDETFFNAPWYEIIKSDEKVTFYDLTLAERNILYIVTALITYREFCAYFIIDEVYLHLLPAMKTNIEFLVSEQAENTIHLITTSSSHVYYEKKNK